MACRSRSRRPYALHCRAGVHARRGGLRRVTPLFCVSAAPQGRGGVRQTGRVLARSCAAPLSRLAPTLPVCGARIALRVLKHTCVLRPLRCREAAKTGAVSEGRSYAFYRRTGDNERSDGRLPYEKQLSPPQAALDSAAPYRGAFRAAVTPKPPLQGEVDAPQGADGGVHCRLATEISCKPRQGLAPASVGDDACIVPEALRRRRPPCGGLDRPPYIAAGNGRNRYTSAFRQPRRRADASIGPYAEG